jgi:hypothetical protein
MNKLDWKDKFKKLNIILTNLKIIILTIIFFKSNKIVILFYKILLNWK